MKKITDFIVDKKYFILTIFIILAGVSLVISSKVVINHDITKYLPDSSEIRSGMDIMEKEFHEETSSFNIMFKDLTEDEKENIYDYLESVSSVESITYKNNENYNKDGYTMYVVNVDGNADSKTATDVFNTVLEHYKDKEVYTSGTVSDRNASVVSFLIIGMAILCAMIILILMCESYVEPFLFLFSIGIGVLLNKGTNIMFSSVSNITDSIVAILQMALSMDYSIMLMNRYIQEKEKEKDKVKAMKTALYKSFASISSSSVTTIVGLLALVFMSFTIGRDLGFVLAKGVLFSLLAIFTCLPALILIFDKLIIKTKKKSPVFNLKHLGKFAYKIRYVAPVLFVLVFVGSYFLKGNLTILYTSSEDNEVGHVFPENNQIAVIYKNEYEELVTDYCKSLENNEKVDTVLCYGNTIDEALTYKELNKKLDTLGTDIAIDDYLLKILYYNYYHKENNLKMTLNEFVKFIESDVYKNKGISKNIDKDMKDNISVLRNFVEPSQIKKQRSLKDLATIFGMKESDLESILILYNASITNTKMSVTDFIKFMNGTVLKDKTYSNGIDNKTKASLNKVSAFINKDTINKKMTVKEMASLFGMNEADITSLYTYSFIEQESQSKMTMHDFAYFLENGVLTKEEYKNMLSESQKASIKLLSIFSNEEIIKSDMNSLELSNLFGMNENEIKQIMLMYYSNHDSGSTYTVKNFVNTIAYLRNNTHYLDGVNVDGILALQSNTALMNSTKEYRASELASMLGVPTDSLYSLYALCDYGTNHTSFWKLSPYTFVNFLLENQSHPKLSGSLNEETLTKLKTLSGIMNSTFNHVTFGYKEMSLAIGMDKTTTKMIYGLYDASKTLIKMAPREFVNIVLTHKNDSMLKGKINKETVSQLELLQSVMKSVVSNTKYKASELAKVFGMNTHDLQLIYSLYDVKIANKNITVSINDFVSFIKNTVLKDATYKEQFDTSSRDKINAIATIIDTSLENKKLTSNELYKNLHKLSSDLSSDLVEILYIYYGSVNDFDVESKLTIEEVIRYLHDELLNDSRFKEFLDKDMKETIKDSKGLIDDAKNMLVGDTYSRMVLNTTYELEGEETFHFIKDIKNKLQSNNEEIYVIGDSPMAFEMSGTFNDELNFITILTMIFIFVVVAFTFKSILIPFILVLLIQCAVYLTMGFLSFNGGSVYFISLLIVQSILMGATIDYAILYTSYYLEHRKTMGKLESIIESYNKSMHTILTSSSILVIVTLVVGYFASAIAAKICKTISQGTLCSTILILLLLPAMLVAMDKLIVKKK